VLTSTFSNFPNFPPTQLTLDSIANNEALVASLAYPFERGGKREKRTQVAEDTTTVATRNTLDSERQLTFETQRSFIAVLLARSALNLAREDLKSFSTVVDVNRERFRAGDLAEADFMKIELQRLQFEQDVSGAARCSANRGRPPTPYPGEGRSRYAAWRATRHTCPILGDG